MQHTRELDGAVAVDILVQPRASKARFGPVHGDRIKVSVTAPPVDGAANKAVVEFISKLFHVSKSAVEVTQGHSSRRKRIRIEGIDAAAVSRELSS